MDALPESETLPALHTVDQSAFEAKLIRLIAETHSAYIFATEYELDDDITSSMIHETREDWWMSALLGATRPHPARDGLTSPCDVLAWVRTNFHPVSTAGVEELARELQQLRRGNAESVSAFWSRFSGLLTKITAEIASSSLDTVFDQLLKSIAMQAVRSSDSAATDWLTDHLDIPIATALHPP